MTSAARARPSLHPRPWRGRVRQLITGRRRLVTALLVGVAAAGLPSPVIASSGGGRRITDAENTRTVYLVVAILVLLAAGLAVFTWWFWRSTRREHEALAPLEVMSDRKFLASDAVARQVLLDGNRPVGAAPLAPGAPEPLLAPADDEATTDADGAPATLVVAAVGAGAAADSALADGEVEIATRRTDPPVTTNGVATTVIAVQESGEADDDTSAETDDPVDPVEADASARGDDAPVQTHDVPVAMEGDATQAIDVTAREAPAAAAPALEPSIDDDVSPATTNRSAPVPIDPGLHVPRADDEPVRQLSLAELAVLNSHAPVSFDEDELASTPSTGIPVIESAEAWVQRQLAGAHGGPAIGHGESDHDTEPAEGDEPGEPTRAGVRGAE